MAAAVARHAHEPNQEYRDRLIQRTFAEIRDEHELIALKLPPLTTDELASISDEAALQVMYEFPELSDAELVGWFEMRCLYLEARAREQKAPARVRGKLLHRRLMRRWFGA